MTDLAVVFALALITGCAGRYARLDAELHARAQRDEFSGVVVIANGSAVELAKPYGEGITLDRCFNLASASKMFTIVAVEQLIEAGKLRRSDRVGAYVTSFPAAADVTIEQLLAHTSGLPAGVTPQFFDTLAREHDLDAALTALASPLDFPPGTRKQYSNIGYVMLGRIVETASGEPFDRYVEKHILGPAGMQHTSAQGTGCATPMTHGLGGPAAPGAKRQPFSPPLATPAGGWSASAPDLLRFAQALRERRLVSVAPDALGLGQRSWGTHRMIGHNGGAPGMNAEIWLLDADETIIVLSNFDPPAATSVADQIATLLTGTPPPPVAAGKLRLRRP
ncbi:MAG: beta-lactamase family protein [Deltaproteobacteria bacterium]|nr:beta-lactamase family protein [Deltaproteobacteria bacterium]